MGIGDVTNDVSPVVFGTFGSSEANAPVYDPNVPLLPPPADHFQALSADTGDFGAQIAKLVLEAAYEDKQMSKGMRQAEEKAQERADNAQLKQLKSEANAKLAAGVVGGACSAAGGLGMMKGGKFEGMGRAVDGCGRMMSAVGEAGASGHGIEAKHQEQLAGRHERAAEDARDAAKDASDMIDRAIEFYKEYRTAQVDNQKAAIHRA
jgi:hypothetical protein